MLTVEIRLNGRMIAAARITNISELADFSDYTVETREDGFPEAGLPPGRADFTLRNFPRLASVWSIIAAVAQRAHAIRHQDLGGIKDAS